MSDIHDESNRVERARDILRAEARALENAATHLDSRFAEIAGVILGLRGKVILTGVGKSGIVGMKIAATLSSTGTRALFLHSVDAVMGDLGVLSRDDLLMAISNSGETSEVINVVSAAAQVGVEAVAVTNNPESTLARECRYLLPLHVSGEAGPLGLAPTTSTTVTMALGDALAMVLMGEKRFTREQFAVFHPGGNLGRRLSLKVRDIMRAGEQLPLVRASERIAAAIQQMSTKGPLGVTLVQDDAGKLVGIVTDGDLRRLLEKGTATPDLLALPLAGLMRRTPKVVEGDALASEALRIMEVNGITSLAVVDPLGRPAGLIHMHDILGRGKFLL